MPVSDIPPMPVSLIVPVSEPVAPVPLVPAFRALLPPPHPKSAAASTQAEACIVHFMGYTSLPETDPGCPILPGERKTPGGPPR
jgi:hypothetical protein